MFVTKTGNKLFIRLTFLVAFIMLTAIEVFSLPTGPPAKVEEAFKQQFPSVSDVKWEQNERHFIANFKDQKTLMKVFFDSVGNKLESEKEIEIADLPEKVVLYLKTQDETAKIIKANRIDKTIGNRDIVLYDVVAKVHSKKSTYTISKDGYLTSRR
jgi:hypothetical protein